MVAEPVASSPREAPALPHRTQVEVTGACNLRCRMCIVRYAPPLSRRDSMRFEQFKRLVDGLPGLTEVVLQGIGEPLLAPDIYRMLAYASERGISAGFNTNATLLTHNAATHLLDAGIDWLCFSLDGATPETYEFVRDRSSFAVVERNISRFIALKRQRGLERPRLSLVMVLMQRNFREIPDVVRRAAGWGIDEVFVQNLSHDFSDAPPEAYAAIAAYVSEQSVETIPRDELDGVYDEARQVAGSLGVKLRLPSADERPPHLLVDGQPVACTWPWDSGYVAYDGTVMPCCMVMGRDRVALGNLRQASYAEIWDGEAFRAFRRGLTDGNPHPVCRGCAMYHGKF